MVYRSLVGSEVPGSRCAIDVPLTRVFGPLSTPCGLSCLHAMQWAPLDFGCLPGPPAGLEAPWSCLQVGATPGCLPPFPSSLAKKQKSELVKLPQEVPLFHQTSVHTP